MVFHIKTFHPSLRNLIPCLLPSMPPVEDEEEECCLLVEYVYIHSQRAHTHTLHTCTHTCSFLDGNAVSLKLKQNCLCGGFTPETGKV